MSNNMQQDHHHSHKLEVKNLHVHYRSNCVLHKINFEATCHHMLALSGPNGSGKSTLLKAIAGTVPFSEGEILWNGEPIKQCRYEIAYLPQQSDIDWNFPITVKSFIETGRYAHLGNWGKYQEKDEKAVQKAIEQMGLKDIQNRQIGKLSGGQQQRTFVARALAQEAHVLLLDEPLNALDADGKKELLTHLRALAHDGHLVIIALHDPSLVETYCDQQLSLEPNNYKLTNLND